MRTEAQASRGEWSAGEYQARIDEYLRILEDQDDGENDLLWEQCRQKIEAAQDEYLRIVEEQDDGENEVPNTAVLLAFEEMQIKTRKAQEYYRRHEISFESMRIKYYRKHCIS